MPQTENLPAKPAEPVVVGRDRIIKRRVWFLASLLVLVTVLGPYLYSRTIAESQRIVVRGSVKVGGPTDKSGLKIVSYNIAHGRGLAESNWQGGTAEDRIQRLEAIGDLLKSLDVDIVVLNEVDFDCSWSNGINQAEFLAQRAEFPCWVEQRNLDFRVLFWTWRFGNAVLSKHPIVSAEVIDLPGYSGWETVLAGKKRGINCEIEIAETQPIRLLGVHLSHRSEPLRTQSANYLIDIAQNSESPAFIAGDLNSTPTGFPESRNGGELGNAIDKLDASKLFNRVPASPPDSPENLTFHSADPKSVIDWVLIPKVVQHLDYQVISSALSDHRPVLLVVD